MKKIDKISLIIAGILTFLAGLLHVTFFKFYNSPEVMACLNHGEWAIIHTLILGSILLAFMVAYISVIHPVDLMRLSIGKPLLIGFSLLYLIRLVAELLIFGFSGAGSIQWIIICFIMAAIYLRIFVKSLKTEIE